MIVCSARVFVLFLELFLEVLDAWIPFLWTRGGLAATIPLGAESLVDPASYVEAARMVDPSSLVVAARLVDPTRFVDPIAL